MLLKRKPLSSSIDSKLKLDNMYTSTGVAHGALKNHTGEVMCVTFLTMSRFLAQTTAHNIGFRILYWYIAARSTSGMAAALVTFVLLVEDSLLPQQRICRRA